MGTVYEGHCVVLPHIPKHTNSPFGGGPNDSEGIDSNPGNHSLYVSVV